MKALPALLLLTTLACQAAAHGHHDHDGGKHDHDDGDHHGGGHHGGGHHGGGHHDGGHHGGGHHGGGHHGGGHDGGDCDEGIVKDKDRACPVGYFYAGETTEPMEVEPNTTGRDFAARRGPRSQVYSCYLIHKGPFTWAEATKKCGDEEDAPGTLLSVNNYGEYSVLTGDMFLQNAFGMDGEGKVTLPTGPTITSGVSLAPDSWTWFGAGSNTSAMNSTIVDSLNSTVAEGSTACLAAEFRREGEVVVLKYSAVACVDSFSMAICEVRVYEQTWYVWFTTSWLQILFLLTLVLLLVSSCVTFQIWVSRPARRARVSPRRPDSPPAYSPREEEHPPTKARLATDAAKYMEKGKDILAKVVFYRKPEDKQRLHPTA